MTKMAISKQHLTDLSEAFNAPHKETDTQNKIIAFLNALIEDNALTPKEKYELLVQKQKNDKKEWKISKVIAAHLTNKTILDKFLILSDSFYAAGITTKWSKEFAHKKQEILNHIDAIKD